MSHRDNTQAIDQQNMKGNDGRHDDVDTSRGEWSDCDSPGIAGNLIYGARAIVWDPDSRQLLFCVEGWTRNHARSRDLEMAVIDEAGALLWQGTWRHDARLTRPVAFGADYTCEPPKSYQPGS